jgi:hypothetical protein
MTRREREIAKLRPQREEEEVRGRRKRGTIRHDK